MRQVRTLSYSAWIPRKDEYMQKILLRKQENGGIYCFFLYNFKSR